MTTDHELYGEWDAAYVLGALAASDRRAFESHMEGCAICEQAVRELAPMPGLLGRVKPSADEADPVPVPTDLVSRMEERERRERRRRRARAVLVAAVACLLLAAAVVVQQVRSQPEQTVALTAVQDTTMTAEIELDPKAWGTKLRIECSYPEGSKWDTDGKPWTYVLLVTDEAGNVTEVSSWAAVSGKTVTFEAATAIELEDMASFTVKKGNGETVLAGSL